MNTGQQTAKLPMLLPGLQLGRYWQFALLGAVLIVLYFEVLVGLARQGANDPNYSHLFFVPLICGYLLWQRRQKVAAIDPTPANSAILLVLFAQVLLFVGSLGAELFLARTSLLLTLIGLVLFFRGAPTLRAIAFPVAFLGFMVPLPAIVYNEIVFPLQLIASRLAVRVLDTLNLFPVIREGNQLILPNYTIEVVEACSGIRSLMSLLTLAVAYVYLAEVRTWVRVSLVAAMVPLAIVSNSLRVVSAAIITNYWGPRYAEGFLHTFSGVLIFLAAAGMMLGLHRLLKLVPSRQEAITR